MQHSASEYVPTSEPGSAPAIPQSLEQMFDQYDENQNQVLDWDEICRLASHVINATADRLTVILENRIVNAYNPKCSQQENDKMNAAAQKTMSVLLIETSIRLAHLPAGPDSQRRMRAVLGPNLFTGGRTAQMTRQQFVRNYNGNG